jgi:hypothetical protein
MYNPLMTEVGRAVDDNRRRDACRDALGRRAARLVPGHRPWRRSAAEADTL